jgi:glycosyltransferase involved in cell wall biosynthesis
VANVLYITYDGLTDPLGRSQVLPYLQGCAAKGHRITILSCEKPDRFVSGRATVEELCRKSGIDWHPLRYHKSPPVISTIYDARMLTRAAARLQKESRFDLVHCRGYISAIAGLTLKRRLGVPLLFDMRGFWPEEKTEGGAWNLGNPLYRAVYRYFKGLESDLLRESDHIVILTRAGKRQLLSRPECKNQADRISVIPCCVDFDHFPIADALRSRARAKLGINPQTKVLGYLGSLGGNYMLHEMLEFFRLFLDRNPDSLFLFVTMDDPGSIREAALRRGFDPERMIVRPARREEVPSIIAAADLGVAFKQPSFSALACSPTKLGEMLAMGIPVIANSGVGDVAAAVEQSGGGAIVHSLEETAYAAAIETAKNVAVRPEKVRSAAATIFDLQTGVSAYDSIYAAIIANEVGTRQGVS